MNQHIKFMHLACDMARLGEGRTSPNPPVGAVIVNDDRVVGKGYHPRAGEPHAEIFALQDAGELARGGDIYVTLEPCSHHGKTPPCADALIRAGLKRVFIGTTDPNPQVSGAGIERLRQAGIEVHTDILKAECLRLISPFSKHVSSGLPYTIYKTAMTLDGQTATATGDSRWVSGTESRSMVHLLRDRMDAIMIGVGTALSDNPLLNTRLSDGKGHDPVRVVVDSELRMPPDSRMFTMASEAPTLIATVSDDRDKMKALEDVGAEILVFTAHKGQVPLMNLWLELGKRNIMSLLLEGGATLAHAALQAGLIDRLMLFIAPKLLCGSPVFGIFSGAGAERMSEALPLADVTYEQVGNDLLISGDLKECLPG